MSKLTYLIISGLLSFNFLKNGLFPFLTADILFVLMLGWSIFGWVYYYHENSPIYNKNIYWALGILVLFFLSSLAPLFRYNQDLISTCIAMRTNVLIIYLITLLKIYPSEDDLFHSFRFLGLLAIGMAILVFVFPHWFVDMDSVKRLLARQSNGSSDLLVIWPGSACAVLYFYMLLQKMRQEPNAQHILWCTLFMAYIFLMQNRSTLICALFFYVYVFLKTDIQHKSWIIVGGSLIAGTYIFNILSGLIEETQSQLSDTKYNRWQAIYFFLMEQPNNLYTLLLGNGVPCKGSAYLYYITQAQTKRLAFISDIGLLGSFFYYGLAMMGGIYSFILKGIIRGKAFPLFLRYYCWWLLLIPTIQGFGLGDFSMIRYSLIFYMIIYYEHQNERIDNNRELQYS